MFTETEVAEYAAKCRHPHHEDIYCRPGRCWEMTDDLETVARWMADDAKAKECVEAFQPLAKFGRTVRQSQAGDSEMFEQATARPWELGGPYPSTSVIALSAVGCNIPGHETPNEYELIAYLDQRTTGEPDPVARANAALIVEAVNNHELLTKQNDRLRVAVEAARQFIRNGIEFGFIRLPDPGSNDAALQTLAQLDVAGGAHAEAGN
ncbi:hypothetical protein [Planctomyces sp. SH-PL14]|uniref:hypothetical protein n=1 Tax=Planctomyces sp. SH-PL14 TaxID=1632864 RepID=UPI00078DCA30|nr:hypothetical protein [Planctomyces sp. SH-PL14]AMV20445.1 hypothetical protein VT03_21280 [Planctomyces sp. SH-PL14]